MHTDGYEHHGIDLRFDRPDQRIDFTALVNAFCWLYPQTDVFIDLATARDRDGGNDRFGVKDTKVSGVEGDSPLIRFVDADGTECEIQCEVVAGTDGSRSICRFLIPENLHVGQRADTDGYVWPNLLTDLVMASNALGSGAPTASMKTRRRLHRGCSAAKDIPMKPPIECPMTSNDSAP